MTPHDVYVEGKGIRIPRRQGWAKAAKEKLTQVTLLGGNFKNFRGKIIDVGL
jgi:hypothetical protein